MDTVKQRQAAEQYTVYMWCKYKRVIVSVMRKEICCLSLVVVQYFYTQTYHNPRSVTLKSSSMARKLLRLTAQVCSMRNDSDKCCLVTTKARQ